MNQPDKKPGSAPLEESQQPLPLFRPEALASQQQKLYGEILLMRPLSLIFLVWLGVAMAGCVLGFLLLGKTTEKVRVPGVLLPDVLSQGALLQDRERAAVQTEAALFVPGRFVKFVQPGERLLLIGPADERQSVTVKKISGSFVSASEIPRQEGMSVPSPMYRIVVTLSSPISGAASITNAAADSSGTRVEAEIPLGRKPLIKWLFERPGV